MKDAIEHLRCASLACIGVFLLVALMIGPIVFVPILAQMALEWAAK